MATGNGSVTASGGSVGGVGRTNVRRSLSTSGLSSSGQAAFAPPLQGHASSQMQAYGANKKRGSLPQTPTAGGGGVGQLQQHNLPPQQQNFATYGGLSETRRWGGPDARGWGPDSVAKPKWGQEPGWRKAGSVSSFEDQLHQPNALFDQYPTANAVGPLAVGGRTWGQDGLGTSFNSPLSPEPTYAEWQAGKKARFPLFKNGGSLPSLWLVVKNITPQVSFAAHLHLSHLPHTSRSLTFILLCVSHLV